MRHIRVLRRLKAFVLWHLIYIYAHSKIDIDLTLTRINATLQHSYGIDRTYVKAFLLGYILCYVLLGACHLGHYSYLIFVDHDVGRLFCVNRCG